MGRVVVEVMPKPEILDPQGKAVVGALPRLGFTQFTSVRQGKRFELEVDGPVTPEILAAAEEAGEVIRASCLVPLTCPVPSSSRRCWPRTEHPRRTPARTR